MKINSAAGYERYQSYVQGVKNGEAAEIKGAAGQKAAANNTDKVTFSGDAAARAEAARLAKGVAAEVESAAGAERLETLRTAVQNGSYHVASEDIADAILDRLV